MSAIANRLRLQAEDLHILNPASETVKCFSLGADRITELEALIRDVAIPALECFAHSAPVSLQCGNFHHPKEMRHSYDEPCIPEARYYAARANGATALTKLREAIK